MSPICAELHERACADWAGLLSDVEAQSLDSLALSSAAEILLRGAPAARTEEAVSAVARLLCHPAAHVREGAVRGLGVAAGLSLAESMLRTALLDSARRVRACAAEALGATL